MGSPIRWRDDGGVGDARGGGAHQHLHIRDSPGTDDLAHGLFHLRAGPPGAVRIRRLSQ